MENDNRGIIREKNTNQNKSGEILGCYNGGTGAYESTKLNLNKCYYTNELNKPVGNKTVEGTVLYKLSYIKTQEFKNELNLNLKEITDEEIDMDELKEWELGTNEYPTFKIKN